MNHSTTTRPAPSRYVYDGRRVLTDAGAVSPEMNSHSECHLGEMARAIYDHAWRLDDRQLDAARHFVELHRRNDLCWAAASSLADKGPVKGVTLQVELSDQDAWSLAQLLKRICWSDVRSCAVDDDETREMLHAVELVRRGLAAVGVSPR